jgi:hypothetical protein
VKEPSIDFLFDESAILVTKVTDLVHLRYPDLPVGAFYVEKLNTKRSVVIDYNAEGEMTFNGVVIYTEDFMSLVGMCDLVTDSPQLSVVFKGEGDMWD